MKIKELLELTQSMKLTEIAKTRLDVGEKKAREALKQAGAYSISGRSGWYFDGDESILERSIYDFVSPTKSKVVRKAVVKEVNRAQKEAAATVEKVAKEAKKPTAVNNPTSQLINLSEIPTSKPTNNKTFKKVTYEIEESVHNQLKIKAIIENRTISELVNEILKGALG